jgi:preprotein translocase subunit SecD
MSNYSSYPPAPPLPPQPPTLPKRKSNTVVLVLGILLAALVLLAGVTFAAYKIVKTTIMKTTIVIFEPELGNISDVSQADLEKTAAILQARWTALGHDPLFSKFEVDNGIRIKATIPEKFADDPALESIKAKGLVELVEMGNTPVITGMTIATDYDSNSLPGDDGLVHHTILTNKDFESVSVGDSPTGGYYISFTMTEQGTKIFADYTAKHMGEYVAITLDGVVIECPVIKNPITDGKGIIEGNFTQESAADLAAILKTEPLPIRLK